MSVIEAEMQPAVEELVQAGFDYGRVPMGYREELEETARMVRGRARVAVENMLEIGKLLLSVKGHLPHGVFIEWVRAECSFSPRMATNMMNAARLYGGKSETVADLNPSILYLLAAPSTPEEARVEIEVMSQADRLDLTTASTREIIQRYIPEDSDLVLQAKLPTIERSNEWTSRIFEAEQRRPNGDRPSTCVIEFDGVLPVAGQAVVYGMIDPRDDLLFYVGSTLNFERRMTEHARLNIASAVANRHTEIYEAGLRTHSLVLATANEVDELIVLERHFIDANRRTVVNAVLPSTPPGVRGKAVAQFADPLGFAEQPQPITPREVKRLRDEPRKPEPTPARAVYVEPTPTPDHEEAAAIAEVAAEREQEEAERMAKDGAATVAEAEPPMPRDLAMLGFYFRKANATQWTIVHDDEPEPYESSWCYGPADCIEDVRDMLSSNRESVGDQWIANALGRSNPTNVDFMSAINMATDKEIEEALVSLSTEDKHWEARAAALRVRLDELEYGRTASAPFPPKEEFAAIEEAVELSITPSAAEAMRASAERWRSLREDLTLPALRTDERLEDAQMLRDLLVAARDTARAHYGELTGRDTDLLCFERSVARMLEPLQSLVAILEKGTPA